jgi:hypothetical protein
MSHIYHTIKSKQTNSSQARDQQTKGANSSWSFPQTILSPLLFSTFEQCAHITNKGGNMHFIVQNDLQGVGHRRAPASGSAPLLLPHPITQRCPGG